MIREFKNLKIGTILEIYGLKPNVAQWLSKPGIMFVSKIDYSEFENPLLKVKVYLYYYSFETNRLSCLVLNLDNAYILDEQLMIKTPLYNLKFI